MSNNKEIFENFYAEVYEKIANKVFLQKYGILNIRELVFTIYTLTKFDKSNEHITLRFTKSRVSNKIYEQIKNIDCIYDIITKLIKIDNAHNKKIGKKMTTYNYIKY